MLVASNISSSNEGSGTSITKTRATAATGTAHSTTPFPASGEVFGASAMAYLPACAAAPPARSWARKMAARIAATTA